MAQIERMDFRIVVRTSLVAGSCWLAGGSVPVSEKPDKSSSDSVARGSYGSVLNTFKRSQYGKFVAKWAGALAVLDLAWLLAFARTTDQLVPAGFLLIGFAFMSWRAWRSGTVIQTEERLIVRGNSWTYKLAKRDVTHFTAESGPVWPRPFSGTFLVAELSDGRLRAFKDFNGPISDAGQHDIEQVAVALNSAWHLR